MSDTAISKTAHKSYHLTLGHGDRSITDQGDGGGDGQFWCRGQPWRTAIDRLFLPASYAVTSK